MKLGHLHIGFKDLKAATDWMKLALEATPKYQNPRMAVYDFGHTSLIFDQSEEDTTTVIAFDSENCDIDFDRMVARGAEVDEAPADLPWGVRAAYLKGPGRVTIEIEELKAR